MADMKSAYELAMERLGRAAPTVKLTVKQKRQLADLDSVYAAKIAEREIMLNGELAKVFDDPEKTSSLQEQFFQDRKKIQAQLEDKKQQIRAGTIAS